MATAAVAAGLGTRDIFGVTPDAASAVARVLDVCGEGLVVLLAEPEPLNPSQNMPGVAEPGGAFLSDNCVGDDTGFRDGAVAAVAVTAGAVARVADGAAGAGDSGGVCLGVGAGGKPLYSL